MDKDIQNIYFLMIVMWVMLLGVCILEIGYLRERVGFFDHMFEIDRHERKAEMKTTREYYKHTDEKVKAHTKEWTHAYLKSINFKKMVEDECQSSSRYF